MFCKHYESNTHKKSAVCDKCGACIPKLSIKVLREIQFFIPPQCSPSETLLALRSKQQKIKISSINYKNNRKDLVEWTIDICESFNLKKITAHLSVYLMDLSHSISNIPQSLYQSIAITCILISSKSEQSSHVPSIKELSEYAQGNFKALELEILGLIN